MKRISVATMIAALMVLLAACGSTKTVTKTVVAAALSRSSTASITTPTSTSTTSTTTTQSGPPECSTLAPNKEGYCTKGGHKYQIANSDGIAHLKSMSVKLNGVTSADSLSGDDGEETATAQGVFVVFNVTVTNRDDSPQSYGGGIEAQAILGVGDHPFRSYTENFNAENGPDAASCIDANNSEPIQPGESATCDVVFDVPQAVLAQIPTSGNLDFVNFGDDVTDDNAPGTVAVFRLENPAVTISTS